MARDYKHENEAYKSKPDQVRLRVQRNQAHAAWEKAHGKVPKGYHVDHIKPLSSGGTNAPSNLRLLKAGDNSSFDRKGPGGKQVGDAHRSGKK